MATAAAAAAEANAASAERTAARAAKKLARQQEKSKAAAKSRPATKNPVRDAARQRRATAGHQTMVTTFEVLLRLLLMAAGGSVAGYLGWAYFGTFGYNLTVMVALLGLGLWSAVGGRVSMVVIAVALHFGTVVRAFGEENFTTKLLRTTLGTGLRIAAQLLKCGFFSSFPQVPLSLLHRRSLEPGQA